MPFCRFHVLRLRLTTDALTVVQVASYIYYVLSYIPYGRKGAQKLAKAALSVRALAYAAAAPTV